MVSDPARNLQANDEPGLSRVTLEPVMARAARLGDTATVAAIGAELSARTWQNVNPYAAWAAPGG